MKGLLKWLIFFILIYFVTFDMVEDPHTQIICGEPFMVIAMCTIGMQEGNLFSKSEGIMLNFIYVRIQMLSPILPYELPRNYVNLSHMTEADWGLNCELV